MYLNWISVGKSNNNALDLTLNSSFKIYFIYFYPVKIEV